MPDTRLILGRPDGGTVRISIVEIDLRRFVEIGRFDSTTQLRAAVRVRPDELDSVVDAYSRCRAVLLGAPDPRADAARAQEAAGLPAKRRGR